MVADEEKQVEEVGVDEQGEAVEELSPEEMKEQMTQLFTTGKKDYVEEKFESAVNSLEEAVQLADKVFGLKAPETFEYYLYYGKALLEVGREENVIFQNAQKGIPTQDDSMVAADTSVLTEGTLETIKEQVEEAIEENTKALEGNAEEAEKAKEKAEEGEKSDEGTEKKDDVEEGDDAEEEGDDVADEDEEEQEPIQAAWEIFEHCRLICENQEESKEWDLKRADVFMYLGDCSAENSNFDQAIEDLCKSQELKEKHGCIGRELADVFIELARVYKLADNFHSAAQFYEKSKATLEQQIGVLEKEEANEATTKEITDIRGILNDLQVQIDDVIESTKQVDAYKTMAGDQSTSTTSKIPSAPLDGKAGTTIEARKAPKRPASSDPSEDAENMEAKKMKEAVEKEKTDTTDATETPRENIDGSLTTA